MPTLAIISAHIMQTHLNHHNYLPLIHHFTKSFNIFLKLIYLQGNLKLQILTLRPSHH